MADLDKFKDVHLMEKNRVDSFQDWPFGEESNCSISKMAEAGFYWSGNQREEDTVTCFVCSKTLDGWESTDDPWKEHEKHAPQCMFVKFGRKEQDLLLEEFLKIFGEVVKNKLVKSTNDTKKKIIKVASIEQEKFTRNK